MRGLAETSRTGGALLLAAVCGMIAETAIATTYDYNGEFFNGIQDDAPPVGTYTVAMRVMTSISSDLIAFSLDDGSQLLQGADSAARFDVQTDANGDLLFWDIWLTRQNADSSLSRILSFRRSGGVPLFGVAGRIDLDAATANMGSPFDLATVRGPR